MTTEMMTVDEIEQCRKSFHAIWGPDGAEDIEVLCDMARLAATEIPRYENQLDAIMHALGIEDSFERPEDEIRRRLGELESGHEQLTAAHAREQEMREVVGLASVFVKGHMIWDAVTNHPERPEVTLGDRIEQALSHPTDTKAVGEGK